MLGIGWFAPAFLGAHFLAAGEDEGARMMIPFVGFSEYGADVFNVDPMAGILMFMPTAAQVESFLRERG